LGRVGGLADEQVGEAGEREQQCPTRDVPRAMVAGRARVEALEDGLERERGALCAREDVQHGLLQRPPA
jgi:hypothetical protein